jgi:hypothetical protein
LQQWAKNHQPFAIGYFAIGKPELRGKLDASHCIPSKVRSWIGSVGPVAF